MQSRSEDTREHILAAARDCFSKSGFDATGVAEICAAAGVSKGAFYHHFPAKQAVFLELLQRWLAEIETRLTAIRQETPDIPEALLLMAATVGQVLQAADGQLPLFLEFWTQSSRDPEIWQATITPYHRFQSFFEDLIRSGVTQGSIRPVDPQVAARLILSLAVGVIFQGLLDPQGADWEDTLRHGLLDWFESWKDRAA